MKARIVLGLGIGCLALYVLAQSIAEARFQKPDLQKIEVTRLIKNLEDIIKKQDKSLPVYYNLARVHAMAYSLKVDSCEIVKKKVVTEEGDDSGTPKEKGKDKGKGKGTTPGKGKGPMLDSSPQIWFGFTPPLIPFHKVVATTDKEKLATAKKHLEKAIANYDIVVKNDPNHLGAQLGLAWCTEQSGDKDEAIKLYREVIEAGWDKEHKLKAGPLGGNFVTKEAGGYLIPLLDPDKDGSEIESIQQRAAILSKLPRPITPIAIPLRDGLSASDLEDKNASVLFDADGTGPRKWTWINKDAGWLVYDPLQSGKVTSGLELFGNVTFWCFWDNGYQALRSLDDNGDGLLTGEELRGLAIWHDANGNGICDPGEVRPLSYFGIVGLSCAAQTDIQHPDRIVYSPRGVMMRDGTTRPSYDLILKQR